MKRKGDPNKKNGVWKKRDCNIVDSNNKINLCVSFRGHQQKGLLMSASKFCGAVTLVTHVLRITTGILAVLKEVLRGSTLSIPANSEM